MMALGLCVATGVGVWRRPFAPFAAATAFTPATALTPAAALARGAFSAGFRRGHPCLSNILALSPRQIWRGRLHFCSNGHR